MLCTILQATQIQSIPKPAVTSTPTNSESDAPPAMEDQRQSVGCDDLPVPKTIGSAPASALQPTLKPEPAWLLTEDMDEHIDSFMSDSDRIRFSRTSHNFHYAVEYFCRRRLKLEYQSDPKPFQSFQDPAKRKDIRFPTDQKGLHYVTSVLFNRPFALGKVKAGHCSLQEALQILQINGMRIDNFLRADTTSKEASTRVTNFRRLIECGILSIDECVQATGDASEGIIDTVPFEYYFLEGSLNKSRLLELTRAEAQLLAQPLVQRLIFAVRTYTANEVLDLPPSALEAHLEQLRQHLLLQIPDND